MGGSVGVGLGHFAILALEIFVHLNFVCIYFICLLVRVLSLKQVSSNQKFVLQHGWCSKHMIDSLYSDLMILFM